MMMPILTLFTCLFGHPSCLNATAIIIDESTGQRIRPIIQEWFDRVFKHNHTLKIDHSRHPIDAL